MQIALPMCAKQSKSSCVFFSFFWVPFQSWCGRVPGKPKTPWVLNIHIFSWSPNGWFRDFGRFCRWGTTKNKVFAGLKHPIDIQKSSTQGGFLKLRQFLVAGFWGGWKGLDVQAPESTCIHLPVSLISGLISLQHDQILVILLPKKEFVPVAMFQHVPVDINYTSTSSESSLQNIMLIRQQVLNLAHN